MAMVRMRFFPSGTADQYDALADQLRDVPEPEGRLALVTGPLDGGWQVVHVWADRATLDAYDAEWFLPALGRLGGSGFPESPVVREFEAHDVVRDGVPPDRWQRHDWWGTVLDTDDVATLTRFYADLRGWRIHHLDEEDGALDCGEGVAYLSVQRNPDYVRPVWPGAPGEQQMMLHLDFEVEDLAAEVARAVALGAELAEHQPQAEVRVLLDPAGHPFCLYTA